MNLRIEPTTHKAAKYAVEKWHYSKRMPAGKLVKFGVWENNFFIGTVIFGRGANGAVPKSLGYEITECCELVRVALRKHSTPTTRIVSIALKMLKRLNPGMKMVYSYADLTNQGHKGIIYRAGNWKCHGIRESVGGTVLIKGKLVHYRSLSRRYNGIENMPDYVREAIKNKLRLKKYFFTYKLRD